MRLLSFMIFASPPDRLHVAVLDSERSPVLKLIYNLSLFPLVIDVHASSTAVHDCYRLGQQTVQLLSLSLSLSRCPSAPFFEDLLTTASCAVVSTACVLPPVECPPQGIFFSPLFPVFNSRSDRGRVVDELADGASKASAKKGASNGARGREEAEAKEGRELLGELLRTVAALLASGPVHREEFLQVEQKGCIFL